MRSSLLSLTLAALCLALPAVDFAQAARSNVAATVNSANPTAAPANAGAPASAGTPSNAGAPSNAAGPGPAATAEILKPAADLPPEAAAVKKALETKFPGATISNVTKSPYFGLYEAQFDDRVVYTDATVNYVVVGAIYDANSKKNLTEARQRELNRVAWESLPLALAFKRVEGDVKKLDNVTIYTFLFPIDQLHPDAGRKSALIWCSADRAKSWDEFFASGKLPDNKGDCPTPIKDTARLGEKLHVTA